MGRSGSVALWRLSVIWTFNHQRNGCPPEDDAAQPDFYARKMGCRYEKGRSQFERVAGPNLEPVSAGLFSPATLAGARIWVSESMGQTLSISIRPGVESASHRGGKYPQRIFIKSRHL